MSTKYKIIPMLDRLLVKPIPEEENNNVLLIPDSAKEKPQRGEVIAVGPGKKDEPMITKVGDIVYYRQGSGVLVEDGLLLMKEGVDTVAILEVIAGDN